MRFLVLFLFALHTSDRRPQVIRFDREIPGTVPAGWTLAATHPGAPPRWESIRDESAPSPPTAFAQLSRDKAAGGFPLAIWNGVPTRDGEISVAFKAVDGSIDRAAGIVWRYQ